MLTGIGTTGALTAALSLSADLALPEQRGRAMLIPTLGKSFGQAAGFAVAGWLIGKVQMRLSFENNAVVVVEVVEGEVGADGAPLLYHSGAYGQPAPLDYEI